MRTAIHRRVVARLLWAFLLGSGLACAGPGERTERALELDLPADWSVAPGTEVALDADWWRAYGDEQTWALVEEALQHDKSVLVNPDAAPLVKALGSRQAKVIIVGTSLRQLAYNLAKRGDRNVNKVLEEYQTFFVPTVHQGSPSMTLYRKDVKVFATLHNQMKRKKRKKRKFLRQRDKQAIRAMERFYFPQGEKSVKVYAAFPCDTLYVTQRKTSKRS